MTRLAGADRERMQGLLDELGDEVERLLLGGMTTANDATREKLSMTLREVSRRRLLRLGATVSNVSREIERHLRSDSEFSARRLSFFIGRTWLLCRAMARALREGDDVTFDRLALDRHSERVEAVRVVTLGVVKKVVPGSFCAFDFRMRRLDGDRPGESVAFTEMFPLKKGQQIPAESFLVIERGKKYRPAMLLEGKVITFRDVDLQRSSAGLRISRGRPDEAGAVELGEVYDGWASLPAWDPVGARERVATYEVDPVQMPNDLHEEVILDGWSLAAPRKDDSGAPRRIHPVKWSGLELDGVVSKGVEGEALRKNLERMRKGTLPAGLGPGAAPKTDESSRTKKTRAKKTRAKTTKASKTASSDAASASTRRAPVSEGRLFGLLHYETCRFVLQPLALLTERGPIHLTTSPEGIDRKALLENLSLR